MANEDDLSFEGHPGYRRPGEKKTIEEYHKLDEEDESLRRYKESLGISSGGDALEDPNDPRLVIILSLGLESAGRPDIVIGLSGPGAVDNLKKQTFVIKEGCEFRMVSGLQLSTGEENVGSILTSFKKVKFRVQRQILSGLSYVQVIKRAGMPSKSSEMIGSYSPNTKKNPEYTKKFAPETAPSGLMARGKYSAKSTFVDDDKQQHLLFEWNFEVKKDWE